MAIKRGPRPVLSRSLTDAVEQIMDDAIDAGVDFEDIESDDTPSIKPKAEKNTERLNDLVELKSKGSAIPGQSLTNSPEQPYAWEQPPVFANPRDALEDVVDSLLQPDAVKQLTKALLDGASVSDIAISVLYLKFFEGKVTPDVMLLLIEPVMYVIMGIAEQGNIEYNIDGDDIEEPVEDEIAETKELLMNEFAKLRKQVSEKDIQVTNLEGSVDRSLLDKIEQEGPAIRESLLAKGEENE